MIPETEHQRELRLSEERGESPEQRAARHRHAMGFNVPENFDQRDARLAREEGVRLHGKVIPETPEQREVRLAREATSVPPVPGETASDRATRLALSRSELLPGETPEQARARLTNPATDPVSVVMAGQRGEVLPGESLEAARLRLSRPVPGESAAQRVQRLINA